MADANPDALIKRVRRLIATADRWRDSAEKVLYWAGCSLKDPGKSEFNDRAYNLVDRCFMIHEHKQPFKNRERPEKNQNGLSRNGEVLCRRQSEWRLHLLRPTHQGGR